MFLERLGKQAGAQTAQWGPDATSMENGAAPVTTCRGHARGRGRDRHGRENRGHGRGPSDGRGRCGPAHPPNSRRRIARRHDAARPNALPHTEAASSNPRAIYSDFPPDTSSPPPRQTPAPAEVAARKPREVVAALRSALQSTPAPGKSRRRPELPRQLELFLRKFSFPSSPLDWWLHHSGSPAEEESL